MFTLRKQDHHQATEAFAEAYLEPSDPAIAPDSEDRALKAPMAAEPDAPTAQRLTNVNCIDVVMLGNWAAIEENMSPTILAFRKNRTLPQHNT
jgi:hypothetical protein